MKNTHLKGLIITIVGVLLLSLESLLIKLTSITALTFAFYIGIFMFISTNIVLIISKKKDFIKAYKTNFWAIISCAFLLGMSNILFISSIKNTTVANAVIIFSCAPIFSALYMYLFFKQKSSKNIFISSFFIFLGLYIIFSSNLGFGNNIGNIYALICIILFSLAFVILSRYENINMFAVISLSSVVSTIYSYIFTTTINIDINTLFILLLTGLLISPIARLLMGAGTKILPASEVSLLMIIETIMAPVWVWIFMKEIPNSSTLMGGSLILITLIINSLYVLKINRSRV